MSHKNHMRAQRKKKKKKKKKKKTQREGGRSKRTTGAKTPARRETRPNIGLCQRRGEEAGGERENSSCNALKH